MSNETELTLPELAGVVDAIVEESDKIKNAITDKHSAEAAVAFLTTRIAPLRSAAEILKKAKHEEHSQARAAEKALDELHDGVSNQVLRWKTEQDRLAKLAALESDAKARSADEDVRLTEAAALEAEGRTAEAEQLLNDPAEKSPAGPSAVEDTTLAGAKFGAPSWKGECTDIAALAAAAIDPDQPTIPLDAIQPNQKLLTAQARSLKKSFAWPGCKAVPSDEKLRLT